MSPTVNKNTGFRATPESWNLRARLAGECCAALRRNWIARDQTSTLGQASRRSSCSFGRRRARTDEARGPVRRQRPVCRICPAFLLCMMRPRASTGLALFHLAIRSRSGTRETPPACSKLLIGHNKRDAGPGRLLRRSDDESGRRLCAPWQQQSISSASVLFSLPLRFTVARAGASRRADENPEISRTSCPAFSRRAGGDEKNGARLTGRVRARDAPMEREERRARKMG